MLICNVIDLVTGSRHFEVYRSLVHAVCERLARLNGLSISESDWLEKMNQTFRSLDIASKGREFNKSAIRNVASKSAERSIQRELNLAQAESLKNANQLLDDMIGLQDVKLAVNQVRMYFSLRDIHLKDDSDNELPLNHLFLGNPGTGKETVAKVLALLYHAYGITSAPKLVFGRAI